MPISDYDRIFGSKILNQPDTKPTSSSYEGIFGVFSPTATPDTPEVSRPILDEAALQNGDDARIFISQAPARDEKDDTFIRKVLRLVLPRGLEVKFGLTEPNIQEQMMKNEDARSSYLRLQRMQETFKKAGVPEDIEQSPEKYIPSEYKEPTTFLGQLKEGLVYGYYATVKPALGYTLEAIGQMVGSPNLVQKGEKFGDEQVAQLLKKPELFKPTDLKGFFEGGAMDPRYYARTIGETAPFVAVILGSTALAGLTKNPLLVKAVAYGTVGAIEQASAYQQMIKRGIPADKAAPASVVYGSISSVIENMFGFKPAEIVLGKTGRDLVFNNFRQFLVKELPKYGKNILVKSLQEGGEESAQQLTQNLITKWFDQSQGVWENVAESFPAGTIGALPFGVSEIISDARRIKKEKEISGEIIQKPITPTPQQAVTPETISPALDRVQKSINEYQRTGETYEGDIQPRNASLESLQRDAELPDVKIEMQKRVQDAIDNGFVKPNEDGTITLYRAGNPVTEDRFVSATYDKKIAQQFVDKATTPISITEFKVKPEDIKVFIGQAESEVLVSSTILMKKAPTVQPDITTEQRGVVRGFARKFANLEMTWGQFVIQLKKIFPSANGITLEDIGSQARIFQEQSVSREQKVADIEQYVLDRLREKPKKVPAPVTQKKFVKPEVVQKIVIISEGKDAEAQAKILMELELAQAGERVHFENVAGEQQTIGVPSTFSKWIPAKLRRKDLVNAVLEHIKADTIPTKADEVRLYNVVAEHIGLINAIKNEAQSQEIDVNALFNDPQINDTISTISGAENKGVADETQKQPEVPSPTGEVQQEEKVTPALDLQIDDKVEVFDSAGKPRGTGIVLKIEDKGITIKDDFTGLPIRYNLNFEFKKVAAEVTRPRVESAAEEFKVGDVIDTQGKSNMVDNVTIREVKGNSLYFTDAEGTDFSGSSRSTVRKLINAGSWKRVVEAVKKQPPQAPPGIASPEDTTTRKLAKKVQKGDLDENITGSPARGSSVGRFNEEVDVELGHLNDVHPFEFPELIQIAKELTGQYPSISTRFRRALGKFYSIERGRIKLSAELFKIENYLQLAKVLAHEIGHLVDYLPDLTLARGNLLGRLFSLRKYMKGVFGEVEVKNKDIKKELYETSKYWRPFDEEATSEAYLRYRRSATELYADAISVLFNSPGTLQRMAPTFYEQFFSSLDAKPEVKEAYFETQALLSHDREHLLGVRRQRTRDMFDTADYKAKELQAKEEREKQFRLKDYWEAFKFSVKSTNQAMYDRVNEVEKRGGTINDDDNPKYLLSGSNYFSGLVKAEFEENVSPIKKELEQNDIDWKTLGEFVFYERIIAGDRSELANPLGITPVSAQELVDSIHKALGNEKFAILEKNADAFRKFLKKIATEAQEVGLFNKERFDLSAGNDKYVTFQVIEYMENNVTWKAKPQIGTLKDINNPANASLLKTISTMRAIEAQKNKVASFKFLEREFPEDIKDSKMVFTGKAQRPVPDKDSKKWAMVTYYENGKLRGKDVDPYIAASLEKGTIATNRAVMRVFSPLSFLNQRLFRPLFVIYNPGWIPFNAIRDFFRFWKNTPKLTFWRAALRYGQALRPAKVRVFGVKEGASEKDVQAVTLIREMERNKVLAITWNDMLSGAEIEDSQIDTILSKIGLGENEKRPAFILRPFVSILRAIRSVGDFVETLPKVAGYLELQNRMAPNQMRDFIRKNIGSPDFFDKGYLTPVTNNVFLFSNAVIQAISSDSYIATNPKTRSGFWFKTAESVVIPKMLMFAALAGLFGEGLKKLFEDVSEYDMTNYINIPLGRDATTGKTIYHRIPMDETGRLIGALQWKLMTAFTNEQSFAKDLGDIAGLFGGQLPTVTPIISSVASWGQFLTGQNPYDSFRGRPVLTEREYKAGGTIALKKFLLWQFQQLGGNVFVKFYAGEQTPTVKSKGEEFLGYPIVSNVVGRFIKISDYGQIEKARDVVERIEGENARKSILEDRVINDYVGKYQDGEKNQEKQNELGDALVREILGHEPEDKEEDTKRNALLKKFDIAIQRGFADPTVTIMINATTNKAKIELLQMYKDTMTEEQYKNFEDLLIEHKIISPDVYLEIK